MHHLYVGVSVIQEFLLYLLQIFSIEFLYLVYLCVTGQGIWLKEILVLLVEMRRYDQENEHLQCVPVHIYIFKQRSSLLQYGMYILDLNLINGTCLQVPYNSLSWCKNWLGPRVNITRAPQVPAVMQKINTVYIIHTSYLNFSIRCHIMSSKSSSFPRCKWGVLLLYRTEIASFLFCRG